MTVHHQNSETDQPVWHRLTNVKKIEANKLTADAVVPAQSPWFSGHFPNEPILPGIAQIALVREAIQQVHGTALAVKSLKRIRFRQIILPDDPINIVVEAQDAPQTVFDFKIRVGQEVAASGTMVMTQTT